MPSLRRSSNLAGAKYIQWLSELDSDFETSEKLSLAKPLRRQESIFKSFCDFASGEAIPLGFAWVILLELFRNLIF
jgi:hypothetical protein